jgi:hypothetical protein
LPYDIYSFLCGRYNPKKRVKKNPKKELKKKKKKGIEKGFRV